jgi:hypothetical protein
MVMLTRRTYNDTVNFCSAQTATIFLSKKCSRLNIQIQHTAFATCNSPQLAEYVVM